MAPRGCSPSWDTPLSSRWTAYRRGCPPPGNSNCLIYPTTFPYCVLFASLIRKSSSRWKLRPSSRAGTGTSFLIHFLTTVTRKALPSDVSVEIREGDYVRQFVHALAHQTDGSLSSPRRQRPVPRRT